MVQLTFFERLDLVRTISYNVGYGAGDNMDQLLSDYRDDDRLIALLESHGIEWRTPQPTV